MKPSIVCWKVLFQFRLSFTLSLLGPPNILVAHLSKREIQTLLFTQFACVLSPARLFVTLGTVVRQPPLSRGFPRQEYWSGLPFPPLGHLSDPGLKSPTQAASPVSTALAGRFLTTAPLGTPSSHSCFILNVALKLSLF